MYKVIEIFPSIQGEGRWVGHPMTFVRFHGCNLKCPWCDQLEARTGEFENMSIDDIVIEVETYGRKRVCLTGGEPLLQLDEKLLVALVQRGFLLHLETNGTIYSDFPFHWTTVSPKGPIDMRMYDRADELKFIVDQHFHPAQVIASVKQAQVYLQPCNYTNAIDVQSLTRTLDLLKNHPNWALSIQLHKLIGVR